MTAPDTDTLAGLLARLRGQDPIPSRSEVADAIEALAAKDKARIERLEAALRWYGEQARLARLIHSEGDAGRNALARDGGEYARAALEDGE